MLKQMSSKLLILLLIYSQLAFGQQSLNGVSVGGMSFGASAAPPPLTGLVQDPNCKPGDVAIPLTDRGITVQQTCIYTEMNGTPSAGTVRTATDVTSFMSAANAANCGDVIQVQSGVSLPGNIVLPTKTCDINHWITVRPSLYSSLPPEGTRAKPCYWNVASLPGRPPFNCSPQTVGYTFSGAGTGTTLKFSANSSYWRFIGAEITRVAGTGQVTQLLDTASGGINHIIFDRSWLHGTANDETRRALSRDHASYIALIASYTGDFHCISSVGQCIDSQVFSGGTNNNAAEFDHGWKVWNTFLESGAEEIELGGGASVNAPCDIEDRQNFFFKPETWNPASPTYNGGVNGHAFVVKNHWEAKNVCRAWIEGNVFGGQGGGVWGGFSQIGEVFTLTPKNQSINGVNVCPLCSVTNVIFRYNRGSNQNVAFEIGNGPSDSGGYATAGNSYSIHDNQFDSFGLWSNVNGGQNSVAGPSSQPGAPASDLMKNVGIFHNTLVYQTPIVGGYPNAVFNLDGPIGPLQTGLYFQDNLLWGGTYGIVSSYSGTNRCAYGKGMGSGPTWFTACWDPTSLFDYNTIVGGNPAGKNPPWKFPGIHNNFPTDGNAVGFVKYNNGLEGGDYHLASTSPYKGKASDGADPGANIDLVLNTTAGVDQ